MLPVPTKAQLVAFTGRAGESYGGFATQALAQATLLFSVVTGLSDYPDDPDKKQLATYAILQMADRIYLEQPAAEVDASPFQTETIGSYTYAKKTQAMLDKGSGNTGLFWWDLALDQLTVPGQSLIDHGGVETRLFQLQQYETGLRVLLTPADIEDDELVTYTRIS